MTTEHDRANSDQAAILKGGAMNHRPVANGDVNSDGHGLVRIAMEHRTVLHVAALAHQDRADITAGHCGGPEAGASSEPHIANDDG